MHALPCSCVSDQDPVTQPLCVLIWEGIANNPARVPSEKLSFSGHPWSLRGLGGPPSEVAHTRGLTGSSHWPRMGGPRPRCVYFHPGSETRQVELCWGPWLALLCTKPSGATSLWRVPSSSGNPHTLSVRKQAPSSDLPCVTEQRRGPMGG